MTFVISQASLIKRDYFGIGYKKDRVFWGNRKSAPYAFWGVGNWGWAYNPPNPNSGEIFVQ